MAQRIYFPPRTLAPTTQGVFPGYEKHARTNQQPFFSLLGDVLAVYKTPREKLNGILNRCQFLIFTWNWTRKLQKEGMHDDVKHFESGPNFWQKTMSPEVKTKDKMDNHDSPLSKGETNHILLAFLQKGGNSTQLSDLWEKSPATSTSCKNRTYLENKTNDL